jgi:hypothetical protein
MLYLYPMFFEPILEPKSLNDSTQIWVPSFIYVCNWNQGFFFFLNEKKTIVKF